MSVQIKNARRCIVIIVIAGSGVVDFPSAPLDTLSDPLLDSPLG